MTLRTLLSNQLLVSILNPAMWLGAFSKKKSLSRIINVWHTCTLNVNKVYLELNTSALDMCLR